RVRQVNDFTARQGLARDGLCRIDGGRRVDYLDVLYELLPVIQRNIKGASLGYAQIILYEGKEILLLRAKLVQTRFKVFELTPARVIRFAPDRVRPLGLDPAARPKADLDRRHRHAVFVHDHGPNSGLPFGSGLSRSGLC